MDSINFKIDYNSVKKTNPEMGCETLARKSRYILENKLVFDDPVILRAGLYTRLSVDDGDDEVSDSITTQLAIRKRVLDTRAQASKAQDAFAENFENYMDGKISKEQFSKNAIPIRENMKRLEAEEREQRQIMDAMDEKMDSIVALKQLLRDFLKSKYLSKEVVEALVKRIVVGVEHTFTVEYKFDFGE